MRQSTVGARNMAVLLLDESWHGRGFQCLDGLHPKGPSADAMRDELVTELWTQGAELVGITVPRLR